ncbi:cytochrome c maturation protein CcmE [Hymenobacter gummosus]|uniref:Cytochrome c maturation protein CcmE n=1 Tax=Hymenobacter gummosus TaxID=1776032 RepID=A0A431TV90_9BACT|nr:cytochrome c maturation protein CcmE [Hymenobacter gummosus]RTQ45004.1 cytochrome c maturation protein CcmE [Hymenobacter gummosus]
MKKTHLLALVVIAIAISVVMATASDASVYVSFGEAKELAADGDLRKVHVVGRLPHDAQKNIVGMQYNPTVDPNYFTFMLVDTNKVQQQVVYFNPKPQDFEKSEQVVITGNMRNNVFVADKILLKCPSKYVEKDVKGATAAR